MVTGVALVAYCCDSLAGQREGKATLLGKEKLIVERLFFEEWRNKKMKSLAEADLRSLGKDWAKDRRLSSSVFPAGNSLIKFWFRRSPFLQLRIPMQVGSRQLLSSKAVPESRGLPPLPPPSRIAMQYMHISIV